MGGGTRPPEVDLVTVLAKGANFVLFQGVNVKDGSKVDIALHGDTSYFDLGEKFKLTFDPIAK